jgi:hypothetical protein
MRRVVLVASVELTVMGCASSEECADSNRTRESSAPASTWVLDQERFRSEACAEGEASFPQQFGPSLRLCLHKVVFIYTVLM